MSALALGPHMTLQFTKVLDVIEPGGDDEETVGPTVDRSFWVNRSSEKSLAIADQCMAILKEIVPTVAFKLNQQFVGLTVQGAVNNFIVFIPKKQFLSLQAKVEDRPHWKDLLEEKGIEVISVGASRIRFRLTAQDVMEKHDLLKELFSTAYKENAD
jgi:hypothetical protein